MASCTATSYITVHLSFIDAVDKLSLTQSIHQHLDLLIISASLMLRSQHANMLFEYDMYLVARLASSRVRPLFSFPVSHDTPLPLPRTWYAPIHILDESIIYVTSRHPSKLVHLHHRAIHLLSMPPTENPARTQYPSLATSGHFIKRSLCTSLSPPSSHSLRV